MSWDHCTQSEYYLILQHGRTFQNGVSPLWLHHGVTSENLENVDDHVGNLSNYSRVSGVRKRESKAVVNRASTPAIPMCSQMHTYCA